MSERRYPFFIPPTVLIVVVAALIAGGYIWWSEQDHRPRAEVGRFVKAHEVESGTWVKVPTPWDTVDVMLSEPEAELRTRVSTVDPSELRAPKGGSFVGIMTKVASLAQQVPRTDGIDERKVKRPRFSLVADGRRYPLEGELGLHGDSATMSIAGYFAVPGKPNQIQVEVEYDGERGLFGVRGAPSTEGRFSEVRAAARYPGVVKCDPPVITARVDREPFDDNCVFAVERFPYVAGLGWVERGREWLSALVLTGAAPRSVWWTAADGEPAEYRTFDSTEPTYTFGTAVKPVARGKSSSKENVLYTSVPKGATTTLTVALRLDTRLHDFRRRELPDELIVNAVWRIPVR